MAGATTVILVPADGQAVDLAAEAALFAAEAGVASADVVPSATAVDVGTRHIVAVTDPGASRAANATVIGDAITAVGTLQVAPYAPADAEDAYVDDFAVTLVSDDADNLITIDDAAASVNIVYTIDDDGNAEADETTVAFEFTFEGETVPQPGWMTIVRTDGETVTLTLNPVDEVTEPGEYTISAVATNPDGNSSAADVITVTLTDT